MGAQHSRERGEGKIGCILSLLVLAAGIALGVKIIPVYYTDNNLAEFAGDLAGQAGFKPPADLQTELRGRADSLGIPEALAEGAMTIRTVGDPAAGTCTVRLNYTRTIDLYGLYPLTIHTDKTISRVYRDYRQ
jgi:hypothetical protein